MSFYDYANLTGNDAMQFLRAAGVTLYITIVSLLIGSILGIALGIVRCSKNKAVSALPLILIEPLRNSPLVTQLFLIYYGLPMVSSIMLAPYPAAILAISLNTAAFTGTQFHLCDSPGTMGSGTGIGAQLCLHFHSCDCQTGLPAFDSAGHNSVYQPASVLFSGGADWNYGSDQAWTESGSADFETIYDLWNCIPDLLHSFQSPVKTGQRFGKEAVV